MRCGSKLCSVPFFTLTTVKKWSLLFFFLNLLEHVCIQHEMVFHMALRAELIQLLHISILHLQPSSSITVSSSPTYSVNNHLLDCFNLWYKLWNCNTEAFGLDEYWLFGDFNQSCCCCCCCFIRVQRLVQIVLTVIGDRMENQSRSSVFMKQIWPKEQKLSEWVFIKCNVNNTGLRFRKSYFTYLHRSMILCKSMH